MFKFENIAKVGDRIRAYHFHERYDCYVEGLVTVKDTEGKHHRDGCACFVLKIDVDIWRGQPFTMRGVQNIVYVPMETSDDWDGRIVNLEVNNMTTARDFANAVNPKPHIRLIKLHYSNDTITHNEWWSEVDVRRTVPNFFRTKFGKRETYTFYRGFIIVRNTVQFTNSRPQRKTTLYLFTGTDTLHMDGAGNSVRSAKKRADEILADKTAEYIITPKTSPVAIDITL